MSKVHKLKRLKEAGDMIPSNPVSPNVDLSPVDRIAIELEKLSRKGIISPAVYSQALDLARAQTKIINNIYSRNGRNLEPLIWTLIRQVKARMGS